MKKHFTIFAFLLLLSTFTNAQNVFFVDSNFKSILLSDVSINTNADLEIQQTEAAAFSGALYVNNSNLTDLTGIEAFTNLTQLVCYGNQITSLDLTQNTALNSLDCSFNQLTSLLTNSITLTTIYCNNNKLTSLDVTADSGLNYLTCGYNLLRNLTLGNPVLQYLNCNYNMLHSLSTTGCTQLQTLECAYNSLATLDVSQSPNLSFLYTAFNQLSSLNVSANLQLSFLNCGNNQLLNLNVSANAQLYDLICDYNQIHYLDLSNNPILTGLICNNNLLSSLSIQNGNNINLGSSDNSFNALNNPNLSCIVVDDVAAMYAAWSGSIDAGAYYALTCLPCTVTIPDANFKAALLSNSAINTNLNGEIECSEAESYTGIIFVNSLNISDVTGIEAFPLITNFSCNSNQISKLNLGANTSLVYANCSFNQITSMKLPAGPTFQEISCYNNQLQKLDVSNCANVNFIDCSQNSLTSIDLSNSNVLTYFYCDNNSIDALDLSYNPTLNQLSCKFNTLNYLNVKNGNNLNMTSFYAYGNPNLTCIQVDDTTWANANWTGNIDATASFNTSCAACVVYVPDPNFKALLLADTAINTNLNAEIECTEAAAFTGSIDFGNGANPNITDLTGLEKFTALTYLDCSYNDLTNLDISANTALVTLYAADNLLTSIDISANTNLVNLNLSNNQLSTINTAYNPLLQYIHLANNTISSIDVSQNSALTELILRDNQLTSIDVSQNYSLQGLSLYNNQLTGLNVSANYSLTWYLYCEHNQLLSLDLRNGVNYLLSNFSAYDNPLLTCIEVDDTVYSAANWSSGIDLTMFFSNNCSSSACVINIPDAAFKAALIANLSINTNGNNEIECSEAASYTGAINVSGLGISDLTGIEAFTALTSLDCNSNSLTTLNVSSNISLTDLSCAINQLTVLDVTALSALMSLSAGGNQLTNIDVTACPNLNSLSIFDNQLATIDVSQNPVLGVLNCYNNQLTNIDVSNNPLLFDFTCYTNSLTSLDVSNNPNIVYLFCHGNSISNLNLSQNTLLQWLRCNQNQLTSLDVSNNPALVALYCFNNQIDTLNLSNNNALNRLYCANNQLTRLNVQNGNNINLLAFDATTNALLTCIQVDDDNYMNTTWAAGKDAGASFSLSCGCSVPAPAGIITGNTFVSSCSNQLGIIYSIDTIAFATGYSWNLPPLANIVSNPDSNVIVVDYDAYSSSGNVTVFGTNLCGTGPSSTLLVNFKPIPVVEICRATVDSTTQKIIIEWQKPSETYVDAYAIYRDSSGVYKKLDLQPNTQFSSFLDTGSYPNLRTEKYKIAVFDSCGNIGDISSPFSHQTINLYGSIQPGGVTKLYWNDYIGINDPLRYMNLLRDTIGSGPLTDTLAKNILPQAFMSFTDVSSAAYPLCRYVVEMVYESNCAPSQRMMLSKSTSRSNIKNRIALFDSTSVGLNKLEDKLSNFNLFPNPTAYETQLAYNLQNDAAVEITLYNSVGIKIHTVLNSKQTKGKHTVLLNKQELGIVPGVYLLTLNVDGIKKSKPFILIKN